MIRKTLAGAVFAMLLLPVCLPMFALLARATPDSSSLPACCRRDGRHHCAMTAKAAETATQLAFRAGMAGCPLRQGAFLVAAGTWMPAAANAGIHGGAASFFSPAHEALLSLLVSDYRSHQKRGPPATPLA